MLLDHFVDGFLDFVDDLPGGLLCLANRLVGLSLVTKTVVAGQRPAASLIRPFTTSVFPLMIATPSFSNSVS